MFKSLLKIRMLALLSSLLRSKISKKKRSGALIVLFVLLMLYAFASFTVLFGIMFNGLLLPLWNSGLGWLYFAITGIMAFALCFIGSIFATQTQLFEAGDNELLLAMPIPPSYILASRMTMLLVLNIFFELIVALPAGIVYIMNIKVTAAGIIFFITLFALLPFFVLTLSCLTGWLVALISSKMRNKSFITIVFSLVFLFGYFYIYAQANRYLSYIIQNGEAVAEAVKRILLPAYHFGYAIAANSAASFLWFFLITVLPFAAMYFILSKSFIAIATAGKGTARIKYTEKSLKVSGIMNALVKKELRHFFTSPMYMLNSSLGVIFTLVLPFAFIFKKEQIYGMLSTLPDFESLAGPAALFALCMISSTNFISAPSVSLEGKNLWIAQSLPVDGGDVLVSKAYAHMTVCIPPVVFASVLFAFLIEMTPQMIFLIITVPVIMTVFQALLGVAVNLRFPKFDWINETAVVKQSMSSLIVMFASMGVAVSPLLIYFYVFKQKISPELCFSLFAVILAVASVIMFRHLKKKGNSVFPYLS